MCSCSCLCSLVATCRIGAACERILGLSWQGPRPKRASGRARALPHRQREPVGLAEAARQLGSSATRTPAPAADLVNKPSNVTLVVAHATGSAVSRWPRGSSLATPTSALATSRRHTGSLGSVLVVDGVVVCSDCSGWWCVSMQLAQGASLRV